MFKHTRLWRGSAMVFALLFAVSLMASTILETYRTSVDAFFGTRSQTTVTDPIDGEDPWTFKSSFTSAKDAHDGPPRAHLERVERSEPQF